MTAASQWLHATTGRIATCAHSWMQAVHWVSGSGLYVPSRAHGPKWGPTTLVIAQEIAALTECRPSVDYLARKLKLAERTVQYHLGMLREAGLLVYRTKGTRIQGVGGRASVFERVIPVEFDRALGIRTVGEGATRRPVGAASEHRKTLGKLARKAARKIRKTSPKRRSKTASSGRGRCTPMQGGTSTSSPTALTHIPSEAKLASGQGESTTGKFNNSGQILNNQAHIPNQMPRKARKLNKVGRRHQLARQLINSVPWLGRAAVPRIAWIVRHVADAGWSVLEVQAAAERYVSDREPRRPSAVLAFRLASCHLLYDSAERRKVLVEDWQDSRRAEQARHTGYDEMAGQDRRPASVNVRDLIAEAFRRVDEIAAGPVDDADCFEINVEDGTPPLDLADLDPVWIRQVRKDAAQDLSSITSALTAGMSERDARRLYTNWLVDQALAAQRRTELTPAF